MFPRFVSKCAPWSTTRGIRRVGRAPYVAGSVNFPLEWFLIADPDTFLGFGTNSPLPKKEEKSATIILFVHRFRSWMEVRYKGFLCVIDLSAGERDNAAFRICPPSIIPPFLGMSELGRLPRWKLNPRCKERFAPLAR